MDHREAFIKTKEIYGVGPSALHRQTGINRSHISNFVNSKVDLTTEVLSKLVDGMEQLAPGAKKYYCQLLYGKKLTDYEQMAQEATPQEAALFLNTFSEKLGDLTPELVS